MKIVKFFGERIRMIILGLFIILLGLISPTMTFVSLAKACNKHQSINGDLGE